MIGCQNISPVKTRFHTILYLQRPCDCPGGQRLQRGKSLHRQTGLKSWEWCRRVQGQEDQGTQQQEGGGQQGTPGEVRRHSWKHQQRQQIGSYMSISTRMRRLSVTDRSPKETLCAAAKGACTLAISSIPLLASNQLQSVANRLDCELTKSKFCVSESND